MFKFKKNMHIARTCHLGHIKKLIENYPKRYQTPKYLSFIRNMLEDGWKVKLYEAGVSKYVFVVKDQCIFKIRFSNHKPIYSKQQENDCDYYVGISHKDARTAEDVEETIKNNYQQSPF